MNRWSSVALLLAGAMFLGATVFREPIARAAQTVSATIVGPLDAEGNVKVLDQLDVYEISSSSIRSSTPLPASRGPRQPATPTSCSR